jgi:peptidyl-prolyl cis-trans isomerase D
MIQAAIGGGTDLVAVANQYGVEVDTVRGVSFSASFISGLGSEPKVVGEAFALNQNEVSAPVVGNGGIYVLKTTNKAAGSTPTNIPQVRSTALSSLRAQISSQMINSLKDKAEIDDRRSKFF